MDNFIKRYFLKTYQETGKKPYTVITYFLNFVLPLVALFYTYGLCLESQTSMTSVFLIIECCLWIAVNVLFTMKRFKNGFVKIYLFGLLASLCFTFSFIIIPLARIGGGIADMGVGMNVGDYTMANNGVKKSSSVRMKKSALNWFVYSGRQFVDSPEPTIELEPEYNDENNRVKNETAKEIGYQDAEDAERHGKQYMEMTQQWF